MSSIVIDSIVIERAEGPAALCGVPAVAFTYQDADSILNRWAQSAPATGGYDKCDFVVTFRDGVTYRGRYDLTHRGAIDGGISGQMRDVLGFYSGRHRPAHMTPAAYSEYFRVCTARHPELVAECVAFLDHYQV